MNGIILTITSFFMRSIGMIFNLYVSNQIGSETAGIFSLIMSVYLFCVTIATSGLGLACTNLVSEQFAKNNFQQGFKAVKTCSIFSVALGLGSGLLVCTFSDIIANNWLHNSISSTPLYLIAIGLPFIAISSVINGYFSAVRKGYRNAISQVFELIIKIIVTVVLLKFYVSDGVESVCICLILADVISEICSCTLSFLLYQLDKRKYHIPKITNITFKKRIFQIAFPVSITSYIRSGLNTLKQFIIPAQLALFGFPYSMALSEYGKISGMAMPLIMFPNLFVTSFSGLLIPEFSSFSAKNSQKRLLEICHIVFQITGTFSIYVSSIFICFSNEFSFLAFQNLECANYIYTLSFLILLMYLDNIIDSMLKGLNKQFGVMICNILDLVITIGALYFLLPVWGMSGYLLATFISEIFNFVVSYIQLHKAIGFHLSFSKVIFIPSICAFFSYLFLQLICFYVTNMSFLLKILLFTACFIFCYLVRICM